MRDGVLHSEGRERINGANYQVNGNLASVFAAFCAIVTGKRQM